MATTDVSARIESAMERIRAVSGAGDAAPASEKMRKLTRENEVLQGQLNELKSQRDSDLAELDGLVAQLKPLIGEG